MAADRFKAGDIVHEFDVNRRVYPEAPPGKLWADGGPIYREHFHTRYIVGVEARSYLVGSRPGDTYPSKIGKAKAHERFKTAAEFDDAVWAHDHRQRIARHVETMPVSQLREVAKLIGYVAAHPSEARR